MKFLNFGLWYPEAEDCAACVFGTPHEGDCLGVNVRGEKVFDSGMTSWYASSMETIERNLR